jgi:hypothetical protein
MNIQDSSAQDKKPFGWRSLDAMNMDHLNSEMRKLKG